MKKLIKLLGLSLLSLNVSAEVLYEDYQHKVVFTQAKGENFCRMVFLGNIGTSSNLDLHFIVTDKSKTMYLMLVQSKKVFNNKVTFDKNKLVKIYLEREHFMEESDISGFEVDPYPSDGYWMSAYDNSYKYHHVVNGEDGFIKLKMEQGMKVLEENILLKASAVKSFNRCEKYLRAK